MRKLATATLFMTMTALPGMALAGGGGEGSRMPAGGAHMSSYVNHPNHDPRSHYWQRRSGGQILGAPMVVDQNQRGRVPANPVWAIGR
ncbi:hypothetical protein [Methylobacterium sp. ID0610]|uniref:hypothetical protein n=1 Tax=Methylobacterium carpenticola TaxID=3344827 RepID=UPI0036776B4C